MISISPAWHSPRDGDLAADFCRRLQSRGWPAALFPLRYGDCAFTWRGPGEEPLYVGVEIKTVPDLLACINNHKLAAHQVPGLDKHFTFYWLVIEGPLRPGRDGILEVRRGNLWQPWANMSRYVMYGEVVKYISSITAGSRIRVWRTYDRHETAEAVGALYEWGTKKAWHEHSSYLTWDESGPAPNHAMLNRPGLVWSMLAELPGIGWRRGEVASLHIPTMRVATQLAKEDWLRIPGIGPKTAEGIMSAKGWVVP